MKPNFKRGHLAALKLLTFQYWQLSQLPVYQLLILAAIWEATNLGSI